jgi:hypothetical protein
MREHKGFLTDTDKAFLRGETEYTGDNDAQMRYQRRRAIRERTRNACRDFSLLLDELDPEEVAKLLPFSDDTQDTEGVYSGMADALALFFVSFFDREEVSDVGAREMVDMVVKQGVEQALEARGRELESYQSIRFNEQVPMEELRRRFSTGESLTYEQFQRLQAEGGTVDLRTEVEVCHFSANRDDVRVNFGGEPAEEYFDDAHDTDAGAESADE